MKTVYINLLRDKLAQSHYGRSYRNLPDDGAEQDWIALEATHLYSKLSNL